MGTPHQDTTRWHPASLHDHLVVIGTCLIGTLALASAVVSVALGYWGA